MAFVDEEEKEGKGGVGGESPCLEGSEVRRIFP